MSEVGRWPGMNPILLKRMAGFGARFAPEWVERHVGEGKGSIPRSLAAASPPQAVENRKIISVSEGPKSALFLAGNVRAKIGNSLGHATHGGVMPRTARACNWEHLMISKEQCLRMRPAASTK